MTSRAIVFVDVLVATLLATYLQQASASIFNDDQYVSVKKTKEPALPLAMDITTAKTEVVNMQKLEGQSILDVKNVTDTNMIVNITEPLAEEEIDNDDDDDDGARVQSDGTLSAVWYLAAFGGLVLFFFVVTCSELFMQNPVHARRQMDLPHAGHLRRTRFTQRHATAGNGPETPPPPYHLFAPPSYDDLKVRPLVATIPEKYAEATSPPPPLPPRKPKGDCKEPADASRCKEAADASTFTPVPSSAFIIQRSPQLTPLYNVYAHPQPSPVPVHIINEITRHAMMMQNQHDCEK